MADVSIRGCTVLVVENEFMIAEDLSISLVDAGAIVLGPVSSVSAALALLAAEPDVHGAVLDINLNGQMVFPVADALAVRQVPFVFATGYDQSFVPRAYAGVLRFQKPVDTTKMLRAIGRQIRSRASFRLVTERSPSQ